MNILDSNDPIQDATANGATPTENDCQQSFAQDLDMSQILYQTVIDYSFSANQVQTGPQTGIGLAITPVNPNVQMEIAGAASVNPTGPNITVAPNPLYPFGPSGTWSVEIVGSNFQLPNNSGFISGPLVWSFAYTVNPPNAGYYPGVLNSGIFGCPFASTITITGNTFFKPGMWSVTFQGGFPMNASGTATVAGITVSNFTSAGGWSALAGTSNHFNGTVSIIVPAGGGFFSWTLTMLPEGGPVGVGLGMTFNFLHA